VFQCFPHEKATAGVDRTRVREERSERAWRAAPSAVLDPAPSAVVRQLSISAVQRRGVGGAPPRPPSAANAPPGPAHRDRARAREESAPQRPDREPRDSPPSLHHYQRDRRRMTTATTATTATTMTTTTTTIVTTTKSRLERHENGREHRSRNTARYANQEILRSTPSLQFRARTRPTAGPRSLPDIVRVKQNVR